MSDIRLNIADVEFATDNETREARHELLASFLGAYADDELPAETQSQMAAHLVGCTRCRRELELHRAVRARLGSEPVPAAPAALRERIALGIANAPAPVMVAATPQLAPALVPKSRVHRREWIAACAIGLFAAVAFAVVQVRASAFNSASTATASSPASVPLFAAVLADYRRVSAGDLPGRARDLLAVRAGVPFAVTPLANPDLRLIAAWTSSLSGEPAAVLAYRWNDRVVFQYFVTDGLLFQSPTVRASLAQKRALSATDGAQSMLLWAEPEHGSMLVGDVLPSELVQLRAGHEGR